MSPDPANEVLSGPPGLTMSRAPAKLESVISQALAPFKEVYFIQITRTRLLVSTPPSSHTVQLHSTIVHPSTGKMTQRGHGPIFKGGEEGLGTRDAEQDHTLCGVWAGSNSIGRAATVSSLAWDFAFGKGCVFISYLLLVLV